MPGQKDRAILRDKIPGLFRLKLRTVKKKTQLTLHSFQSAVCNIVGFVERLLPPLGNSDRHSPGNLAPSGLLRETGCFAGDGSDGGRRARRGDRKLPAALPVHPVVEVFASTGWRRQRTIPPARARTGALAAKRHELAARCVTLWEMTPATLCDAITRPLQNG